MTISLVGGFIVGAQHSAIVGTGIQPWPVTALPPPLPTSHRPVLIKSLMSHVITDSTQYNCTCRHHSFHCTQLIAHILWPRTVAQQLLGSALHNIIKHIHSSLWRTIYGYSCMWNDIIPPFGLKCTKTWGTTIPWFISRVISTLNMVAM